MTTIELLRHAAAVSRDQWWGRADRERPLSPAGQEQAGAICRGLASGDPVGLVLSSPLRRCLDTVEPLAGAFGLDVVADDALAEVTSVPVLDGRDTWVAAAWLAGRALGLIERVALEHPGERVVACSHGDVIPAVMALLTGRDRLDLADVRCPKGAWFSLTFDGARCTGATLHRVAASR